MTSYAKQCSGYQCQFLLVKMKTPKSLFGHCVMQNTIYRAKIKQIYLEWNI